VCEEHHAILMVDEAHATGVVGHGGRGAVAAAGLTGRVPVVMGTLSKALGAAGGFIAGSTGLIAFLRNRARAFIFDTATPAPVAARPYWQPTPRNRSTRPFARSRRAALACRRDDPLHHRDRHRRRQDRRSGGARPPRTRRRKARPLSQAGADRRPPRR